jgi:hypothetical protein
LGDHALAHRRAHHRGQCRPRRKDHRFGVDGRERSGDSSFQRSSRGERRVVATEIQTVGVKGYDGIAVMVVQTS